MEPSLEENPHYHKRHHNFIAQSLVALNGALKQFDTQVHVYKNEVLEVLNSIQDSMKINTLFSMQETGLNATYDRDKAVKKWCVSKRIVWKEHINNGVTRGIKNRNNWRNTWTSYMMQPIKPFEASAASFTTADCIGLTEEVLEPKKLEGIQAGGTKNRIGLSRKLFKPTTQKIPAIYIKTRGLHEHIVGVYRLISLGVIFRFVMYGSVPSKQKPKALADFS